MNLSPVIVNAPVYFIVQNIDGGFYFGNLISLFLLIWLLWPDAVIVLSIMNKYILNLL